MTVDVHEKEKLEGNKSKNGRKEQKRPFSAERGKKGNEKKSYREGRMKA